MDFELRDLIDEANFPLWGFMASFVGVIAVIVPMIAYEGRAGEPYSIFNHFISELGEIGVSQLAFVFNFGLIIAGVLYVPFMVGLAVYIDNVLSKLAGVVGVFSALCIVSVGVFPMNFPEHVFAALSFFFSGLIMSVLWTMSILLQRNPVVHKALAIGGVVNIVVFIAFLFGDFEAIGGFTDRPDFWIVPTLEWAVYFAIVGFLLVLSAHVWYLQRDIVLDDEK